MVASVPCHHELLQAHILALPPTVPPRLAPVEALWTSLSVQPTLNDGAAHWVTADRLYTVLALIEAQGNPADENGRPALVGSAAALAERARLYRRPLRAWLVLEAARALTVSRLRFHRGGPASVRDAGPTQPRLVGSVADTQCAITIGLRLPAVFGARGGRARAGPDRGRGCFRRCTH